MSTQTAIIGGGIAGLTAAWQLHRLHQPFTLFESSPRLGGTVETVHHAGFIIECGPDAWVTEKPWASELARDLNLAAELIQSNDATRVTHILQRNRLLSMPDGMRMMVPTNLAALEDSPLFTPAAIAAYAAEPSRAAELRASAPTHDESIASFVQRHFGPEVLAKIAAPLLSGVFGGDVETLSVRAVMPAFVQMERAHGSLIEALRTRTPTHPKPIFTSLRTGTQTLIDRMAAELPRSSIRLNSPISTLTRNSNHWLVDNQPFHHVFLATPAHATGPLLAAVHLQAASLLPLEASSAVITALAFDQDFPLPKGFGFLVPSTESSALLACTFVDQKFPHRAPPGTRLIRAFFGGRTAHQLANSSDEAIALLAHTELQKILGPLPTPAFHVVRHWPRSLPQYAVGHLDRIAQLDALLARTPTLHLLGNPYRGVGLPDLIRDARSAARSAAQANAQTAAQTLIP